MSVSGLPGLLPRALRRKGAAYQKKGANRSDDSQIQFNLHVVLVYIPNYQ